jgi:multicomponent K+:H+ antiporter subunit E
MKRLLPSPLLSASLLALWLMLNLSLSLGQVLLGTLVAWVMPLLMAPLRPAGGPIRHPLVLARLILRVGGDVVLSALSVGRGVLVSRQHAPRGSFVVVPLALRDAHALAALAMITAVVPGTVWCELAPDRSALLLHVFDLDDEATFIEHFKARYEGPLLEIFG